ncbi:MAG: Fe-S cluster assembly sulfur transfer protein SufU [Gemmatimonadota bacterium]
MTIDRSTPDLGSLYQDVILDHYKRPRNQGELESPDADVTVNNPSCGDTIRIQLDLSDDGRVEGVRFRGEGCSISQASVSMLTGLLEGRTADEVDELAERFKRMLHGDDDAARDKALGQARALQGVSKFPTRIRCAFLGWEAAQKAFEQGEADRSAADEGPAS